MKILFRHGPLDGARKLIVVETETIAVLSGESVHHYQQTPRLSEDGYIVFQHLGTMLPVKEANCAA